MADAILFPGHIKSIKQQVQEDGDTSTHDGHPRQTIQLSKSKDFSEAIHKNCRISSQLSTLEDDLRSISEEFEFRDQLGNTPTRSLWVGYVPRSTSGFEILDVFSKFGTVNSTSPANEAKVREGYAFVNYNRVEDAIDALRALHNANPFHGEQPLVVRYTKPPEKNKASRKGSTSYHAREKAGLLQSQSRRASDIAESKSKKTDWPRGLPPSGPRTVGRDISPPPIQRAETYRGNERLRHSDVYRPEHRRASYDSSTRFRMSDTYRPGDEIRGRSRYEENNLDGTLDYDDPPVRRNSSRKRQDSESVLSEDSRLSRSQRDIKYGSNDNRTKSNERHDSRADSFDQESARMNKSISLPRRPSEHLVTRIITTTTPFDNDEAIKDPVPVSTPALISQSLLAEAVGFSKPDVEDNDDYSPATRVSSPRLPQILMAAGENVKDQQSVPQSSSRVDLKFSQYDITAAKAHLITQKRLRAFNDDASSIVSEQTTSSRNSIRHTRCSDCKKVGSDILPGQTLIRCSTCTRRFHSGCGNPRPSSINPGELYRCGRCQSRALNKEIGHCEATTVSELRSPASHERLSNPPCGQELQAQDHAQLSLSPMIQSHEARAIVDNLERSPEQSNTTTRRTNSSLTGNAVPNAKNSGLLSQPTDTGVAGIAPKLTQNPFGTEYGVISLLYKSVTCPWWLMQQGCRLEERDCMFAHVNTGIYAPMRNHKAKLFTCWDWKSGDRCRLREDQCNFAHTDTLFHVGRDGKASVKHITCHWWKTNGHCKFSEAECLYAHHDTGGSAREPVKGSFKNITCPFYLHGGCGRTSDDCFYSHYDTGEYFPKQGSSQGSHSAVELKDLAAQDLATSILPKSVPRVNNSLEHKDESALRDPITVAGTSEHGPSTGLAIGGVNLNEFQKEQTYASVEEEGVIGGMQDSSTNAEGLVVNEHEMGTTSQTEMTVCGTTNTTKREIPEYASKDTSRPNLLIESQAPNNEELNGQTEIENLYKGFGISLQFAPGSILNNRPDCGSFMLRRRKPESVSGETKLDTKQSPHITTTRNFEKESDLLELLISPDSAVTTEDGTSLSSVLDPRKRKREATADTSIDGDQTSTFLGESPLVPSEAGFVEKNIQIVRDPRAKKLKLDGMDRVKLCEECSRPVFGSVDRCLTCRGKDGRKPSYDGSALSRSIQQTNHKADEISTDDLLTTSATEQPIQDDHSNRTEYEDVADADRPKTLKRRITEDVMFVPRKQLRLQLRRLSMPAAKCPPPSLGMFVEGQKSAEDATVSTTNSATLEELTQLERLKKSISIDDERTVTDGTEKFQSESTATENISDHKDATPVIHAEPEAEKHNDDALVFEPDDEHAALSTSSSDRTPVPHDLPQEINDHSSSQAHTIPHISPIQSPVLRVDPEDTSPDCQRCGNTICQCKSSTNEVGNLFSSPIIENTVLAQIPTQTADPNQPKACTLCRQRHKRCLHDSNGVLSPEKCWNYLHSRGWKSDSGRAGRENREIESLATAYAQSSHGADYNNSRTESVDEGEMETSDSDVGADSTNTDRSIVIVSGTNLTWAEDDEDDLPLMQRRKLSQNTKPATQPISVPRKPIVKPGLNQTDDDLAAISRLKARGVKFDSESEDGDEDETIEVSNVFSQLAKPKTSRRLFDIAPGLLRTYQPKTKPKASFYEELKPPKKEFWGNLLAHQCQKRLFDFGNPHHTVNRHLKPRIVTTEIEREAPVSQEWSSTPQLVPVLERKTVRCSFATFIGMPEMPIVCRGRNKHELAFRDGKKGRDRDQEILSRGSRFERRVTEEEKFVFIKD